MTSRAALALSFFCVLAFGCSETPRTEVMVVIDAQCGVRARASELRVRITGEGTDETFTYGVAADGTGWPRRVAVVPKGGDAARDFQVQAEALDTTGPFATARGAAGFASERTLMLRLVLEDTCIGVTCSAPTSHCSAGSCAAAEMRTSPLEDVVPACSGPVPDAGMDAGLDAGPVDAGPVDGRMGDTGMRDGGPTDGGPSVFPVQITAGGVFTCVLSNEGRVKCWGGGDLGQLGDGTMERERLVPSNYVMGLTDVTQVSAGWLHACALRTGGEIWCWGQNNVGQLGNGTTVRSSVPVSAGITDGVSVAAGHNQTCVVHSTGTVSCWGGNGDGQLGDGTRIGKDTPTPISLGSDVASHVAAGGGLNSHSCAALEGGQARCWGANGSRQLGDGSMVVRQQSPVVVVTMTGPLANVVEMDLGYAHSCGRTTTGQVLCWGWNGYGQIGDGMSGFFMSVPEPIVVMGVTGAEELTAGGEVTCARTASQVLCWGHNNAGQIGIGTTDELFATPQVVALGGAATSVSAGDAHVCAIVAASVWCWGDNSRGQLGNSSMIGRSAPVMTVLTL